MMKLITPYVILILFASVLADVFDDIQFEEDKNKSPETVPFDEFVVVLSEENFTDYTRKHDYVLVEFYAPWCAYCKQLAPQYAQAAKTLSDSESPIKLAKVDATDAISLAEEYEIGGYPTLKYFRNGIPIDYSGERSSDGLVQWVNKKMGPPATDLKDVSSAKAFVEQDVVAIIGYFEDQSSDDAKIFLEVAASTGEFSFGITSDPNVFKEFNANSGDIFMYKKFDDGTVQFKGELNVDNLNEFLDVESVPLLADFSEARYSDGRHYCLLVFLNKSRTGTAKVEEVARSAAKQFKGKITFSTVDINVKDNDFILEFSKVNKKETPTIRIIRIESEREVSTFKLEASTITAGAIKKFVNDFLDDKLQKYRLRQKLPKGWDKGDVYTLVADNFDSVVSDASKDVLVEFCSPTSTHCIEMNQEYEEVGRHFKGTSDVIIARLDVTANELDNVNVKTLPTFHLYRKGDNKVIEYGGPRRVKEIARFVTSGGKVGATVEKPDDDDDENEASMRDEL
ncbi:hypothetical protein PPYR_10320 [Photinus pyralis]|uniref:Protein disulfide-isomerase n=1 Tax=Photinus pyralis TaxID=7054 RepID=A0A5N4AG31_PHOPY|nr:protein disulfide-isomerase-like [Photinus pyralis]KAB0796259.1 hypothetical protein PPYR_10320 [Photinus pyralis]